jgi:YVTN family beta-propeller protein
MVMKFKTFLFILVVFLLEASGVNAQTAPVSALLILAKEDNTLLIIDPASLKVTAKLPVGPDPHEVIASPDGTTAGGAYNTLSVIDLAAKKVLPTLDLGALRGPHGLASVGGRVWFTAEAAKAIASYDPATKRVDWIMGTGQNRTHIIYVSPDLNLIVTTNVSSASVSIIEKMGGGVGTGPSSGDWNETFVAVGRGSGFFYPSCVLPNDLVPCFVRGCTSIVAVVHLSIPPSAIATSVQHRTGSAVE